jgi:para-nitrobenzyl esterase
MHRAWVVFAADGDCGWPKYDPSHRPTMRFDTTSQVVDDPLAAELALWEGVRLDEPQVNGAARRRPAR